MQHRLSETEKSQVCSRYQAGETTVVLAANFGVSSTAICGILHRRSIPCRPQNQAQKKRSLNEAAFDVLTPTAAYWVGFLFADGCIFHRAGAPQLTLRLADKDAAHVEHFREFMGSSHKVICVQKGRQISFRSAKIIARLENLGIRGKLLSVADPILINSCDFWRGVIDGDGHIGVKMRTGRPCLELVGGLLLLNQFVRFTSQVCPHSRLSVRPHKTIYRVSASGNTAYTLVSALYTNATATLERKHNAALNILVRGLVRTEPVGDNVGQQVKRLPRSRRVNATE